MIVAPNRPRLAVPKEPKQRLLGCRPSRGSSAFARRFAVVLCRPENAENVGLAARAMKNTGFGELRLVLDRPLDSTAHKTAVHAGPIIDRARVFPDLEEAVADLHLVFAGTAKSRKNFEVLVFEEALDRMLAAPLSARIGLLFGNERTGLTSDELRRSNFRFTIPQATRQPSYNLAAAVLLTLFALFTRSGGGAIVPSWPRRSPLPLPRREQDDLLRRIVETLAERGFIHTTNRRHMEERFSDLFGRLTPTEDDRRLLLALFSKAASRPDRRIKFV